MYILLVLNMQKGGSYMIDLEKLLIIRISSRFKELRQQKYRKISPDLIANGQKSAILRIEQGKNADSGNFISDTLLDSYAKYFNLQKNELIFGREDEFEKDIKLIFYEMFLSVVLKNFTEHNYFIVNNGQLELTVEQSYIKLAYSFADFGRWHDLRRDRALEDEQLWEKEMIDYTSMYKILWKLCKRKIVRSLEEKVIYDIFNETDGKFHFNRINEKFNKWLNSEFAIHIVQEVIEKLEVNSIFKIGFMVKSLIDKFLTHNLPESHLKNIPLEEFYLPQKSYHIKPEEFNAESLALLSKEMDRLEKLTSKKNLTIKDFKELSNHKFHQEIQGVTDNSSPFVNDTRIVSADLFLDYVMSTPDIFDNIHELDRKEQKIPGILTVNSHASNLLQLKISEVIEPMVNDLVRYQNIFINCIKWEELEDFAK